MRTRAFIPLLAAAMVLGCAAVQEAVDEAARQAPAAPATPKSPAAPKAPEATPATGQEEFQGRHLKVWVDGQPTRSTDRKVQGERIWTVEACSANPTVRFQMDARPLGAFKEADVVINPLRSGTADATDLWHCPKVRTDLKPDQPLQLDRFNHIAEGKIAQAAKLPPGPYALTVQVNGQKTWDRQVIHVTVK